MELVQNETQIATSRVLSRLADSISYNDRRASDSINY